MHILDRMWKSEGNSVDLALGLELRSPGSYSKCLYLLRCRTTGSLGREIMDGICVPDRQSHWMTFKSLKAFDYMTFRNGKIITS